MESAVKQEKCLLEVLGEARGELGECLALAGIEPPTCADESRALKSMVDSITLAINIAIDLRKELGNLRRQLASLKMQLGS